MPSINAAVAVSAINSAIESISRSECRGYNSSGISIASNNEIHMTNYFLSFNAPKHEVLGNLLLVTIK